MMRNDENRRVGQASLGERRPTNVISGGPALATRSCPTLRLSAFLPLAVLPAAIAIQIVASLLIGAAVAVLVWWVSACWKATIWPKARNGATT